MDPEKFIPARPMTSVEEKNDQDCFTSSSRETGGSNIINSAGDFLKYNEETFAEVTLLDIQTSQCDATVKNEKTEKYTVYVENVISNSPEEGSDLCPIESESGDGQDTMVNDNGYKCDFCDKYFSEEKRLNKHKESHVKKSMGNTEHDKSAFGSNQMKGQITKPTNVKPFKCEHCGRCFSRLYHLTRHKRIHTGPFKCNECGEWFSQAYDLIVHNRIHVGEKTFKCEQCGKCFSSIAGLSNHRKVHTVQKPFKCDECGKCFTQLLHLNKHIKTHSGEKRFQCEHCGKCFKHSHHLTMHNRFHTGEKPHKCEHCGKFCFNTSDLSRHIRIHTGEKPFKCEYCSKCFSNSSDLTRHKRIHIGVKPFQCEHCGKCFSDLSYRNRHRKTHENKQITDLM